MEDRRSKIEGGSLQTLTKIIGLTGGIGSGKSTVAKMINEEGFPVYYSDDRSKSIVNDNEELKNKIKALLGSESYDENGSYNKAYVAKKIFDNDDLRLQLNAIIHPAVRIDFEEWVKNQKTEFVFKETALLFELKLNLQCYQSILVTADDNLRIKRVMDRDGKTYREIETVISKQMPENEKVKLADYIIYNNTNLEDLELATKEVLQSLK